MAKAKKQRINHAPIVKAFAARLRERRMAAGLTQVELAAGASLSINYISRLEAARIAPGIDTLAQLAAALHTTPHDLLPADDPPGPTAALTERSRTLLEKVIERPELVRALVPILAKLAEGPDRVK